MNGTHIRVYWEPIPLLQAQGFIRSYFIIVQTIHNNKRQVTAVEVSATKNSTIINGLNPASTYNVLIGATTKAGMGNLRLAPKPVQGK